MKVSYPSYWHCEGSHTIVAAGIDRKADSSDLVGRLGGSLCSTKRTFVVGAADVKLIVVVLVWAEFGCLDLEG